MSDDILAFLDALTIPYRMVGHPPAASAEACAGVSARLGAVVCKNYFLTTKSHRHYRLCVVRPEARLRTSDLSRQAGTPRLSFAGEEELLSLLGVRPGSVTPLALCRDSARDVRLLLDRTLLSDPELAFHPGENTRTLAMSTRDFLERFLPAVGRSAELVDLPGAPEGTE